jgi:hypothetical protein
MDYSKYETCGKYQIPCPYSKGENSDNCLTVGGECNNHLILYVKKNLNKEQIGNEKFSEKISNLEKTIKWVPEFLRD